ncbi:FkbM family methyltransferase [Bacteroidota bacterium]
MIYNPSEILDRVFFNKYLSFVIPVLNFLITLFKQQKKVITYYSREFQRWISKEKNCFLTIDTRPYWNISYSKLKQKTKEICCKHYFPKNTDVVLDVGAGIGTESIVFSNQLNDEARIFAIEANPHTFKSLKMLREMNGFGNLYPYNLAVGDKQDNIYISDRENHEANLIFKTPMNEICIEIEMVSLDTFISENEIKSIDFLKMNIEGAEMKAIEGMKETLKLTKNIAISCHDFLFDHDDMRIKTHITECLQKNKFNVFTNNTGHPVKDSWIYGNKTSI